MKVSLRKRSLAFAALLLIAFVCLGLIVPFTGSNLRRETSENAKDQAPMISGKDSIYRYGDWGSPIVVEDYKLIFFIIPKVGCSEWKRLFRRMKGLPDFAPDIDFQNTHSSPLHNPQLNGLSYLFQYDKFTVQEMMTSPEWTRAVFVREPKERVLSAFLNKFVVHKTYFRDRCCLSSLLHSQKDVELCLQKQDEKDFSYFLKRTLDCKNEHWAPMVDSIDEKWWPFVNFVGYLDNANADAKKLLRSVTDSSGVHAWKKYCETGWGHSGESEFLADDNASHATNAIDQLKTYYNQCNEEFVERVWGSDWEEPTFHFDKFKLYNEADPQCARFRF